MCVFERELCCHQMDRIIMLENRKYGETQLHCVTIYTAFSLLKEILVSTHYVV